MTAPRRLARVYLAGPDVFLPDPAGRFEALKQICARHRLFAISPLDLLPGEADSADAHTIARRNEAHIRRCDAVLANLTPFRGPGADPGTVYEIGYARALGRPVFGYACSGADYATRVRALNGSGLAGDVLDRDADGLQIEDFGMFENLMISCGIEASGGFILAVDVAAPWRDLTVFERCARQAATALERLGLPNT